MNGAKETRTPDPLHAMQVLYQLSYGPMIVGRALGLGLRREEAYTGAGGKTLNHQTWRQTATSLPCTCT